MKLLRKAWLHIDWLWAVALIVIGLLIVLLK
jgi:hypothetical protein